MKTISIIMLLLASGLAHADTFFVKPVTAGTVSSAEASAINALVSQSVNALNGHQTTTNPGQSNYVLTPQVVKLGDSVIMTLTKSQNGVAITSRKMKTSSFNNIDDISERLVSAVINNKSISSTQNVSNITTEEQKNSNVRIEATKQVYFGFGPGFTSGLEGDGAGFNVTAGYHYGLDDNFALSLSGEFYKGSSGDDSSLFNVSIGGNYYLTNEKHAPFIGVALGYGTAEANDNDVIDLSDANGWSGSITAGYKLFRTTNVNLAVMARYTTIFDKIDSKDATTGEDTSELPGVFSINIAIFY